ncbi:uncharacterized protein B0H18DRAFT_1042694 [Fomitopsis serialis]|uniref:uncharacterized protein n=1 Tax=Fomitopsis serialis TaxID=139415 RepID=UPI002008028F|nr:uncharacterized protein B0H18DRAFT_1042694 [Neoantrodia serialis]KAH9915130.1 hypothetical protein B0H18DRAFT_1042694 [Neoantrodia serialis]
MAILPTFYAWSREHIQRVFEAKTSADCLRALDDTFAQNIELTLNGSPIPRTYLQSAIMGMVESSGFRLSVEWLNAVEAPRDESYRSGALGGYYVIRNLRRQSPDSTTHMLYERHKSINVIIESESSDPYVDSRRIVKLALVATDKPMHT